MNKHVVLVNGLGNIGTTLANVLLQYREALNIERVVAYKNRPQHWQQPELEMLASKGAEIVVGEAFGDYPQCSLEPLLERVDYVFDTREHGFATASLPLYQRAVADKNCCLKGASAQGSEKRFGKAYMASMEPALVEGEPFVTVVSCNTHALAAVLQTFTGPRLEGLDYADAVVVRRSEDLGSNGRLVAANIVARHLDDQLGTHHAIDVVDLFASQGVNADITSSDITTPSQAMHALRFHIGLKDEICADELQVRLSAAPYIATTTTFDSAEIMAAGRRYGFQGRIFSHAVVVANQLLHKGKTLRGWAFVPQEACTIISTVAAYCAQLGVNPVGLKTLHKELLQQAW